MKWLLDKVRVANLLTPYGREKRGSSLWSLIEHLSVVVVQFALAIPLVYGLGLENFGIWAYLIAVSAFLGALTPGIAMAATQLISGEEDFSVRAAAIYLAVFGGLFACMAFTALGASVFHYILQNYKPTALAPLSSDLIVSAVTATFLNGVAVQWDVICSAVLRAKLDYRRTSLIEIVGRCVALVVMGILASVGVSVINILYANAILVIARAVIKIRVATKGEQVPRFGKVLRLLKPATHFSVYQWIQNFSAVMYASADRLVVGMFMPASDVAILALASQVAQQIQSIPRAFLTPLAPALIHYKQKGDIQGFESALIDARRRLLVMSGVLTFPCATIGPLVVFLVLNFQISLSVIFPIMLSYIAGYFVMAQSVVPYYKMIGQSRLGLSGIVNVCAALTNLVAAIVLCVLFGPIGVGVSKAAYILPYLLISYRNLSD